MTPKVAIFASGSGSNAEQLILQAPNYNYDVQCVVYNRTRAGVKDRAERYGVRTIYFPKSRFEKDPQFLADLLKDLDIAVIALAGFLLKIPTVILEAFQGNIINIHPSLLPEFGGAGFYGLHVHEAVLMAGKVETGMTIHQVNEEYDRGQILFQARIPVTPAKNPKALAEAVLKLEHIFYPPVLGHFVNARS